MMWGTNLILFAVCVEVVLVNRASGSTYNVRKLPDIYWNTSNPIFRIDNTDHIIDVNKGLVNAFLEYDQVDIICPTYSPGQRRNDDMFEKFIIYHVNKEEYDTCRIMTQHPKMIAKCDTPRRPQKYTISFRSFSPNPGALEYRPGNDYYFISTSSRRDIHQRVDGMCRDNNMKIVFKVADPSRSTTTSSTAAAPVTTASSSSHFMSPFGDSLNEAEGRRQSSSYNEITDGLSDKRQKLSEIDFNSEDGRQKLSSKNKRRRNKKNKKRRHKMKKKLANGGHLNSNNNAFISDASGVLNDNPLKGVDDDDEEPTTQRTSSRVVIEKELSLVEKVNNLMKQEASIGASSSSSSSSPAPSSTIFVAILELAYCFFSGSK